MKKLTQFAVNYPVSVLMGVLAILLLGYISFDHLGIDLFPSLNSPRIFVEIKSGERPPEEMESLFVERIEALSIRQSDVVEVSSVTRTGTAQVTVEYAWDKDMDEAFLDIQKALNSMSQSTDLDELNITQHDPNTSPIMIIGMEHENISDMNELRKVAENYIRNELIRLEGVAEVELTGQEDEEIRIDTDPYRMESFNLSLTSLSQTIESFNRNISGGSVVELGLQYIVKGVSMLQTVEDFENLVVGYKSTVAGQQNAEKTPIFLREVANVSFANKDPENIVHLNGNRCIGLSIYKETRFNTVKAVEDIQESLEQIEKALPGYHFTVVTNQGTFINNAITEVRDTLLAGVLLAIIVLFVFLRRFGTTMIVSLSIPISIIATFNLMFFNGLTLNIMTLGGLALGAGMLVDNAIVVMENIFRNHESGMSVREAAIKGTAEVGGAITASTLTTIVVFLPIVYLKGASSELFREQAWTVAFSLLSSLVVAIFFIPMLYNIFYKNEKTEIKKESVSIKGYGEFVQKLLPRKWAIIGLGVVLVAIAAFVAPLVGSEFMPKAESGEFTVEVKLPEGTPLEKTGSTVLAMEEQFRTLLGDNIKALFSKVGPSSGLSTSEASIFEGENTAEIKLVLAQDSKYTSSQVVNTISDWYDDHPNIKLDFIQEETALQSIMGTEDAPVVVEVRGEDLEVVEKMVNEIYAAVSDVDGLFNFKTNFEDGYPELNLEVDRYQASIYDLSVDDIVNQISGQLEGENAGQIEKGGEMQDVTIRIPELTAHNFRDLILKSGTQVIRVDEVARISEDVSPREIFHRNQTRVGKVMAEMEKDAKLDHTVKKLREKLATVPVPSEYTVKITGEEQKREESMNDLKFAMLLSILLVYMVLASQFESLVHPFVILLTIPLSIVGSILIFYILGRPFNIMALIGIIMLVGIAVNDSIILVDRINQLRRSGMAKAQAIALAGQQRIRPIIMTSLTTILALLPLTFGFGESASLRSPMALAVIGGLITSTLLTLVVIPCVYDVFTREKKS